MDSKSEHQKVNEKTPKKFVFFTRLLLTVFILIVLLVLSVMIFVPRIAKSYINKNGKELTGRKVYIEKIKLNYITSTLHVIGFRFLEQPAVKVDSAIQQREKLRIHLTRQYFAEKSDSSKIRIFDYNREEVLNIGSRPRFEVRYTLAEEAEEK